MSVRPGTAGRRNRSNFHTVNRIPHFNKKASYESVTISPDFPPRFGQVLGFSPDFPVFPASPPPGTAQSANAPRRGPAGRVSWSKSLCSDETVRVWAGELEGAAARLAWDRMPGTPYTARRSASEARTFPPRGGGKVTAFFRKRAAQCPDVAFRPRMPTSSRAAKKSRAGAAGSLNRMMPAIRAPRAPIPVQMA